MYNIVSREWGGGEGILVLAQTLDGHKTRPRDIPEVGCRNKPEPELIWISHDVMGRYIESKR